MVVALTATFGCRPASAPPTRTTTPVEAPPTVAPPTPPVVSDAAAIELVPFAKEDADHASEAAIEAFVGRALHPRVLSRVPGEPDAYLVRIDDVDDGVPLPSILDELAVTHALRRRGLADPGAPFRHSESACARTSLLRVVREPGAGAQPTYRIDGRLDGVCPMLNFEGSLQGDIDGDGRLEFLLLSRTRSSGGPSDEEGMYAPSSVRRRLVVVSAGLAREASFLTLEAFEDADGSGEPADSLVVRFEFRDVDGDGRPELVLDRREVRSSCETDDVWALTETSDCVPRDARRIARYDPAQDRFVIQER